MLATDDNRLPSPRRRLTSWAGRKLGGWGAALLWNHRGRERSGPVAAPLFISVHELGLSGQRWFLNKCCPFKRLLSFGKKHISQLIFLLGTCSKQTAYVFTNHSQRALGSQVTLGNPSRLQPPSSLWLGHAVTTCVLSGSFLDVCQLCSLPVGNSKVSQGEGSKVQSI